MAVTNTAQGTRKRRTRSRIANGTVLLPRGVHSQGRWPRLFREEFERLVNHAGGEDVISEPRRLAARRASVLEAELVEIEGQIALTRAEGKEPNPSLVEHYGRLSERQRRHLETLGVERTARDVTPELHRYLEAKAGEGGGTQGGRVNRGPADGGMGMDVVEHSHHADGTDGGIGQ